MAVTHQIGDLVIELSFQSRAGARRTMEEIQDWLEHELLPELDELLSRYSPGRETLRIDNITLDCGVMTRSNFRQVIQKRLFDELERIVPPRLFALTPDISFALTSDTPPEDAAAQQLLMFLQSGQLPWHRRESNDELHGQLFDSIATRPQLATLLQPALRSAPALRRLVRQFSEARLNQVLASLAPNLLPLAIALQDLFDLSGLSRRLGRAARSAIHEAQWTGLLNMGFARQSAAPDAAALAGLLREWLGPANAQPGLLAAALVAPVTRSGWAEAGAAHRTLAEAVLRLAGSDRDAVVDVPDENTRAARGQQALPSLAASPDSTPLLADAPERAAAAPAGIRERAMDGNALPDADGAATFEQPSADFVPGHGSQAASPLAPDAGPRPGRAQEAERSAPVSDTLPAQEPAMQVTASHGDESRTVDIARSFRDALDANEVPFLVLHWETLRRTLEPGALAAEISSRMRDPDFRARFVAHAPDFLLLDMLAPLQPSVASALRALPGSVAPALWRWMRSVMQTRAPAQAAARRGKRATFDVRASGQADAPAPAPATPASPMPADFRQALWSALFSENFAQSYDSPRLDTIVTRLLVATAPALLADAPDLQLRWLAAVAIDEVAAMDDISTLHREAIESADIAPPAAGAPAGQHASRPAVISTERKSGAAQDASHATHDDIAALLPHVSQVRSRRVQAEAARSARRTRTKLLQAVLARVASAPSPPFTNTELAAIAAGLLERTEIPALPAQRTEQAITLLERIARMPAPRRYLQRLLQALVDGDARAVAELVAAASEADAPTHAAEQRTPARSLIDAATPAETLAVLASRLRTQPSALATIDADASGWQRLVQHYLRTEPGIDATLASVIESALAAQAKSADDMRKLQREALANLLRGRPPLARIAPVPAVEARGAVSVPASASADAAAGTHDPASVPVSTASSRTEHVQPVTEQGSTPNLAPDVISTNRASELTGTAPTDTPVPPAAPGHAPAQDTLRATDPHAHAHAPRSDAHERALAEHTPLTSRPATASEQTPATSDRGIAEETTRARQAGDRTRVDARVTHSSDERSGQAHVAQPQDEAAGRPPVVQVRDADPEQVAYAPDRADPAGQVIAAHPREASAAPAAAQARTEAGERTLAPETAHDAIERVSAPDDDRPGGSERAADALAGRGTDIASSSATIQLDTLAPDALPELCIALGTGSASAYRLHGTETSWLGLLQVYTGEVLGQDPVVRTELLAAIRHHAQRAAQRQRYYQNVLACLVAQVALDLEELESAETPEALAVAPEYTATPPSDAARIGTLPERSDAWPVADDAATARLAAVHEADTEDQADLPSPAATDDAPAGLKSTRSDVPDAMPRRAAETTPRTSAAPATTAARDTTIARSADVESEAASDAASTSERERNPWLVAATLLTRETLSSHERTQLARVLDTILAETQPVRLRGWMKLLADTRLHRGWSAHVPRVQLIRMIQHAATALPDVSQEQRQRLASTDAPHEQSQPLASTDVPHEQRQPLASTDVPHEQLQPLVSTDTPLRIATELYATFMAARRRMQAPPQLRRPADPTPQAQRAGLPAVDTATQDPSTQPAAHETPARQQPAAGSTTYGGHTNTDAGTVDTRATAPTAADATPKGTAATEAGTATRASSGSRTTDITIIEALHAAAIELAQLLAQPALTASAQTQLKHIVDGILQQRDATLLREWRKALGGARVQQGLARHVPAHVLERLVHRLAPEAWPTLEAAARVVVQALGLIVPDARSFAIEQAKWQFLLERALAPGAASTDTDLLTQLAHVLATAAGLTDTAHLLQLVERRRLALAASSQRVQAPPAASADVLRFPGQDSSAVDTEFEGEVHLDNAGLVLAAPYIPRLFAMLNITVGGKFPDHAAAERGVHLLQYIVSGQEFTPEYKLLLNKVLCGILPGFPVCAGIDMTQQEKDTIEQLLLSMIQHWKILGGTSVNGLRQTFLQRQGWLRQDESGWQLEVKPGSFDMLLDQLPWGYSLIKFAWMDKAMHVNWRNKKN